MSTQRAFTPIIFCLFFSVWLAACQAAPITEGLHPYTDTDTTSTTVDAGYIRMLHPPLTVQDFTLPASTGSDLSLSDLQGRWVVMFFGYTRCPDFCPLTLSDYRQVKRLLGDQADQVVFLYVSVDGFRDTPDVLANHLTIFDPEFLGMSGDDQTLSRIQPDYDFYYRRQVVEGSPTRYVVDHSTRSYILSPAGQLVASLAYQAPPEFTANLLRDYITAATLTAQP